MVGSVCTWNSTMCSGNCQAFDILTCGMWDGQQENEARELKMTNCKKRLGPPAKGVRGLEFTPWVSRGYRKILSKRFLCSNHTDCVYSWQNSLLKSQTSCQLLSAPQQMTIVSGPPR